MIQLLVVTLLFSLCPVIAQDAPEELTYYHGTVVKVSPTQLTVSEYSVESDEQTEVIYQVDSKVKLEGIKAVKELKADELVLFGYIQVKDTKIIRELSVDREEELSVEPQSAE